MICERQEGWADLPVEEQARLLGRQGVPYLIADPVRVIDDQGREVPADGESLGEVLMRGNNVMTGYFEDPEQTRETLRGRLVPLGRPRGPPSRRLHRTA